MRRIFLAACLAFCTPAARPDVIQQEKITGNILLQVFRLQLKDDLKFNTIPGYMEILLKAGPTIKSRRFLLLRDIREVRVIENGLSDSGVTLLWKAEIVENGNTLINEIDIPSSVQEPHEFVDRLKNALRY